jgi:hypothetical protein
VAVLIGGRINCRLPFAFITFSPPRRLDMSRPPVLITRTKSFWLPLLLAFGRTQRGKTEYNLVLVHPDNRPKESSVGQMRSGFEGWDISHISRASFTDRAQDSKAPETG